MRVAVLDLDIRADVLPLSARDDTLDEVAVALVELVVADRAHVEPGRVQRVDGGVVVVDERDERRRADQIAGGGEHRVRVVRPHLVDRAGQNRRAGRLAVGFEPSMEVVGSQNIDDGFVVVGGGGGRCQPHTGQAQGGDRRQSTGITPRWAHKSTSGTRVGRR